MSWNRMKFVFIISITSTPAFTATTTCPVSHERHKLTAAEVYDGRPSERASLTSDDNGVWELNYKPASSDGRFYLGCVYGTDRDVVPIKLPGTVKTCEIGTYPEVFCQ